MTKVSGGISEGSLPRLDAAGLGAPFEAVDADDPAEGGVGVVVGRAEELPPAPAAPAAPEAPPAEFAALATRGGGGFVGGGIAGEVPEDDAAETVVFFALSALGAGAESSLRTRKAPAGRAKTNSTTAARLIGL